MKGPRYNPAPERTSQTSRFAPPPVDRAPTAISSAGPARLELTVSVDSLMTRFCERHALAPLQILLRAYPGPLWHPYHQRELLETLETLQSQCQPQLTSEELSLVHGLLISLRASIPPATESCHDREQTALSI